MAPAASAWYVERPAVSRLPRKSANAHLDRTGCSVDRKYCDACKRATTSCAAPLLASPSLTREPTESSRRASIYHGNRANATCTRNFKIRCDEGIFRGGSGCFDENHCTRGVLALHRRSMPWRIVSGAGRSPGSMPGEGRFECRQTSYQMLGSATVTGGPPRAPITSVGARRIRGLHAERKRGDSEQHPGAIELGEEVIRPKSPNTLTLAGASPCTKIATWIVT
jgi:hypothetical protein